MKKISAVALSLLFILSQLAAAAVFRFSPRPNRAHQIPWRPWTVPSLLAVANSPAFLDPNAKPANSQVFLDTIPYLRAFPIHPNWAEIEAIASEELEYGFYGKTDVYQAMLNTVQRTREYFIVK